MYSLKDLEVGQLFRYYVDAYVGLSTFVFEVIAKGDNRILASTVGYITNDFTFCKDSDLGLESFSSDLVVVYFPNV